MPGGQIDAPVVVRAATSLLIALGVLGGCGGPAAERGGSAPPTLAASIPIAPAASAVESEPATPAEPPPLADGSSAAPSQSSLPSASALVSLVDEPPFFWRSRSTIEPTASRSNRHGHAHRPYHPAPGIIVDVVDAQGGASAADLQRAARNLGYWPFRRCYEEGLRRDQRLTGKVSLQVLVDSSGAVERVAATAATLADPSVVTCVAREALHLPLVEGESPTDASMAVTLAIGDEPVPVPLPVPRAGEIREALRAQWPAVAQCYASELSNHPDAGGRMELRFRVSSSGEIVDVAEGDTHFGDADVTRCVLGVYRTAGLPALRDTQRDWSFVYAMHLEPQSNTLPVQ